MKTAVDRVGRGKARQVNARFLAMTSHYVFAPEFCNSAAGWEKGQVEKNVQDSRHLILHLMPDFGDLADLNAWLEQRCLEQWEPVQPATGEALTRACRGHRDSDSLEVSTVIPCL